MPVPATMKIFPIPLLPASMPVASAEAPYDETMSFRLSSCHRVTHLSGYIAFGLGFLSRTNSLFAGEARIEHKHRFELGDVFLQVLILFICVIVVVLPYLV